MKVPTVLQVSSLWLDSVQSEDWLDRAYVSYQEMNPSNTEEEEDRACNIPEKEVKY